MSSFDRPRLIAAIDEVLRAIGEDPAREGLEETPTRVADAYAEFFRGVGKDPLEPLADTFPSPAEGASEPVLVRGIEFRSVCEHHLLPFIGTAHIAYIPGERIVGLGRLAAVVELLASRPQLQERLGEQIAGAIDEALRPQGVLVVLDAEHGCVKLRGARQLRSSTVTIASRGLLTEPLRRAELITLMGELR